MRGKYKLSSVMGTVAVVTLVVFVMLIMAAISYAMRSAYQVEKNAIYEEVVRFEKAQLETEANEIADYIRMSERKASENMRAELKRRVDFAYGLAEQIYSSSSGEKSPQEIERMIADALRNIRFGDDEGYVFMDRFDGEVMLYPVRPETEGFNDLDLKDDFGNFVIRDEINIAKSYGNGYVEGHWLKPDSPNDEGSLKLSYVRRFKNMDWYIGTGLYEEDYLNNVKNRVLSDIIEFKSVNSRGYTYFISNADGGLLVENEKLIYGEKQLEDFMPYKGEDTNKGVFWKTEGESGSSDSSKMAYIIPIESWGWYVGLETEVNENITESKAYYLKGVMKTFNYVTLGLSLLLLIVFAVLMKFFAGRVNYCFSGLQQVMINGEQEDVERPFCFREFEDLVEHVESHKLLEAKSAVPVQMQPQMDIKPIETIVEGEAIAISLIQKLNHIMASDDLDKMTEFKLNRICGSLTSIRKLLTRMSHMEDSAEDNEKTLNLEYLPLKEHLEQIMRLILSEYKELEIESRVICDKDLIVYTDPLIISQIITHLATNAIKHGFDIQTKGCLTIEVIYDVDYLRVYFSDNGKGMSQSIQERIFEPFYTTSGMQGDVGLGLAEVYGLVNDVLGGAINCSSRIGFGTDFFIDIPGIGPGLWFEEPGKTEQSS